MPKPYFTDHKKKIDEIIRVNHAGEFGAQRIYEGQINHTKNEASKELIRHMLEQELVHLDYFTNQIKDHNVRPTILMPLWNIGGYLLGALSAKINNKIAMLTTEAVEEVIESHYQEQINYLQSTDSNNQMLISIKKFQQDEIDHKHIAIAHDSKNAPLAGILFKFIKHLCKSAIYLSKKI